MKPAPSCTKCSTPLPAEYLNSGQYGPCIKCESLVRVEVLPAYFREEAKGSAGEALVIDTEASCFYHPQKRAAVVCSSCGRFLCSLCDLEMDSAHYCGPCLEAAKEKGKIATIENTRRLYDQMALQLVLLSFFFFPAMIVTAPMAIYLSVKFWNKPQSIVGGRPKIRFGIVIGLASLQLLGLIAFAGFLLTR